jgi:hypothetical protein
MTENNRIASGTHFDANESANAFNCCGEEF